MFEHWTLGLERQGEDSYSLDSLLGRVVASYYQFNKALPICYGRAEPEVQTFSIDFCPAYAPSTFLCPG